MTVAIASDRYQTMPYRRAGRSGLKLPTISLGLWQNFGETCDETTARAILTHAFDAGVTHFDLANNYGPPPGSAEELFGRALAREFAAHRDELLVASKAGYQMWDGPYGEWGSRKSMIASCDQSLSRTGLDYFDIFYSHRYDPETPLEETMAALADLVRAGKALYVGLSNYPEPETRAATTILQRLGVPPVLHQPSYSILNRWIEDDHTIDACGELGIGMIAFSPLAQGILSGKYSDRAAVGARGNSNNPFLDARHIPDAALAAAEAIGALARQRGQTSAQVALAWVLRRPEMTSALIGVRTLDQLKENLRALDQLTLSEAELTRIDTASRPALVDQKPRWS